MSDSCDPMDCSPPGSSVHGIFQARILKWSEVKVAQLCPTLRPHELYSPWNSPGQNTGMGSCSLLQGIFPTQGLSPGLSHCRQILYQLSHQGSLRILEWVAYPFSRYSQPRNWTMVSCIAGEFFTNWATREAQLLKWSTSKKKNLKKKRITSKDDNWLC